MYAFLGCSIIFKKPIDAWAIIGNCLCFIERCVFWVEGKLFFMMRWISFGDDI